MLAREPRDCPIGAPAAKRTGGLKSAALDRACRAAPSAPIYSQLGVKHGAKFRVAVPTREIYRRANGDRWLLARDPDTGRVFVRHEPNLPSGGQVAEIEIGTFLIVAGPEKQELLRLIGTLVRGPDPPR
jgi:hypothetical protein